MMENPIKMDDLGVPLFSETSKSVGSTNSSWPKSVALAYLDYHRKLVNG